MIRGLVLSLQLEPFVVSIGSVESGPESTTVQFELEQSFNPDAKDVQQCSEELTRLLGDQNSLLYGQEFSNSWGKANSGAGVKSEIFSMSPQRAAAKRGGVDEDGEVSLLVFYRWCQRLWGHLDLMPFGDVMTTLARSAKEIATELQP